jgi:hypothetical protein
MLLFNLVPVNICSSVYLTPVYVLPELHRLLQQRFRCLSQLEWPSLECKLWSLGNVTAAVDDKMTSVMKGVGRTTFTNVSVVP